MLLGGEPLGERFIWWNFVSSRKERIEQAKEDWKQGRIILPPNDNKEFIPLPEDKSRPAGEPRNQNHFHDRLNHIFSKGVSIRPIPRRVSRSSSQAISRPAAVTNKINLAAGPPQPSRSFVPNIREAGSTPKHSKGENLQFDDKTAIHNLSCHRRHTHAMRLV